MRLSKYILLIILITHIQACGEQKLYIIETDIGLLQPDTINGETIAQSRKRSAIFSEKNKSNTIDKYIPIVPITDFSGKKFNLQDVLTQKTILISSASNCGFGKMSLLDDFPIALDSLKDELQDYEIICLIKRTEGDIEDPARFDQFASELREIYAPLYFIEESDAYKINLIGNPVRFYIDKDQKVTHTAVGASNVENRIIELRANTGNKKN